MQQRSASRSRHSTPLAELETIKWAGPIILPRRSEPIPVETLAGLFGVETHIVLDWSTQYPQLPQPNVTAEGTTYHPDAVGLFLEARGNRVGYIE